MLWVSLNCGHDFHDFNSSTQQPRATVASNIIPIMWLYSPLRMQQMYTLPLRHVGSFMESRKTARAWSVPVRRTRPWRRNSTEPTEAAGGHTVASKKDASLLNAKSNKVSAKPSGT